MSDYENFLKERDQMDVLIQKGYRIKNITENLSGAFADFAKMEGEEEVVETVHVVSPDGRKYMAVLLIQQQKGEAVSN